MVAVSEPPPVKVHLSISVSASRPHGSLHSMRRTRPAAARSALRGGSAIRTGTSGRMDEHEAGATMTSTCCR